MAALSSRLLLLASIVAGACHSSRPHTIAGTAAPGDDVTLYRDIAVIRQRIELDLPATPTTIKAQLAGGVAADQIVLVDRGGLIITGLHARTVPDSDTYGPTVDDEESDQDGSADVEATTAAAPAARTRVKPTELALDVQAPQAGKYSVVVAYTTMALRWDVAYTMTTAATRDRGELRGALAIRNDTGIAIKASSARVIDAELLAWRGKTAEHLAATLVGGTHSSTLPATPRELGRLTLGNGETRVDLVSDGTRRMRSVLVYDPIGTKLDTPGAAPLRDTTLGTIPKASQRVTESFEIARAGSAGPRSTAEGAAELIARDVRGTQGLPAGPVRLIERRADGALIVLGEARLFDAATRVSDVDTIAIGTADGVTAKRERREITIDNEARHLTEEFLITVDNQRAIPVEILVREHLYRGQNWALAYYSAPDTKKDGPQQISLRTRVPAKSQTKIMYVVVYTWGP